MTCRDRLQRFSVDWKSKSTGRWRIEHTFWTREAAQRFFDEYTPLFTGYEWRVHERKPRIPKGA